MRRSGLAGVDLLILGMWAAAHTHEQGKEAAAYPARYFFLGLPTRGSDHGYGAMVFGFIWLEISFLVSLIFI